MATDDEERGCGLALLMLLLSVPVTAVVVWAVIMFVGGVFDVFIDVELAFGIILFTSISVGPAFVAWRRWRPRTPRPAIDK